jgi:hypothetical protein
MVGVENLLKFRGLHFFHGKCEYLLSNRIDSIAIIHDSDQNLSFFLMHLAGINMDALLILRWILFFFYSFSICAFVCPTGTDIIMKCSILFYIFCLKIQMFHFFCRNGFFATAMAARTCN